MNDLGTNIGPDDVLVRTWVWYLVIGTAWSIPSANSLQPKWLSLLIVSQRGWYGLKLLLCVQSQLQGFQNACKGKPLVIIDCLKLLLIKEIMCMWQKFARKAVILVPRGIGISMMKPTPGWLLKYYLESQLWTWNCERKMIDVVKVPIFSLSWSGDEK